MAHFHKIAEYWDTGAVMSPNANPLEEYNLWQKAFDNDPPLEDDLSFSLEDFEKYIESLKESYNEEEACK